MERPGGEQPNTADGNGLGWQFWRLVPVVGCATGLATAGLMALLCAVERPAWDDGGGSLLDRTRNTNPGHRVLILVAADAVAAAVR